MQHKHSEQIMVVVLDDLVHRSIPRINAMRRKLERGDLLSASETAFCLSMLRRLVHCHRIYAQDPQCVKIFSSMAHLLYELVRLAHDNEARLKKPAA